MLCDFGWWPVLAATLDHPDDCRTKVMPNYESACTWDICSLSWLDEIVGCQQESREPMSTNECLDEVHVRILRVTEDLRAIQRELNCAAMQAPGDPELMEALSQLPELEALQVLKSAIDQMRHFLWFYMQVLTNESETGEKIRHTIRQKASNDAKVNHEAMFVEKLKHAGDAALLRYLTDGSKTRKPN